MDDDTEIHVILIPIGVILGLAFLCLLIYGICCLFYGIGWCIVALVKWVIGSNRRQSDPEAGTEMQPSPAYEAGKGPAVQIAEADDALPSQPLPAYTE